MSKVIGMVRKVQCRIERSLNLYRLSRQKSRVSACVSQSIRMALNGTSTPQEKFWIDAIESLRAEMNASTENITFTDFGAGSAGSDRTQKEMQAGAEVTKTLGKISQVASKPPFWCLLLFKLIRSARPSSCLEMGTAVGISSAYQAAALKLNGQGSLVTLDGAASLADVARNNFQNLDLGNIEQVIGSFSDTLSGVLEKRQPVDYAFVDGHHDEQATQAYFEQLLPYLSKSAILVFDDIAWSEGMKRAWNTIAHDKRVSIAVDLGPVGLCVIDRSFDGHRNFEIPLE